MACVASSDELVRELCFYVSFLHDRRAATGDSPRFRLRLRALDGAEGTLVHSFAGPEDARALVEPLIAAVSELDRGRALADGGATLRADASRPLTPGRHRFLLVEWD